MKIEQLFIRLTLAPMMLDYLEAEIQESDVEEEFVSYWARDRAEYIFYKWRRNVGLSDKAEEYIEKIMKPALVDFLVEKKRRLLEDEENY